MGNDSIMANKAGIRRESEILRQYKDELSRELASVNIKREIVLACAAAVLTATILAINLLCLDNQEESLYISLASYRFHILLLCVSIAFIIIFSFQRNIILKNIFAVRLADISINGFVLVICSIIAVNNEIAGQRPFSYLTAMFCIGSMILMTVYERLLVYILSWGVYMAGMIFYVGDSMIIFQNFVFVTMLMALALLISHINYSAYMNNFINRKIIEEKSKELDCLYRINEENLLKRTEELNQVIELEKLRVSFFTNISHELRTPLSVIFSAEQMLERTLKSMQHQEKHKEITQYTSIMKQNCYRLIRLINNLIDMTKIDAGYMQFNPKSCDFVKIVEDITLSTVGFIEDKKISLTFDTDIEEKIMLCDPDMVERIVLNLLSNAVKFTPEGGHIYVCIYDRSDKIILSIKDDGIGIPPEMSEMIFERFIQVDKTSTRAREGSGIGLSLVRSLVDMHGGAISVKSQQGEGSEFIVEIPVIQSHYESSFEQDEYLNKSHNIEKIKIEFSDIYD